MVFILMTNLFYVQGQQQPTIAGFIPGQQQQERVSSQLLAISNSVEQAASSTTSARNSSELSVSAAVLKNPLTIGDVQQIVVRVFDAKTKNPVQGATVSAALIEPAVTGALKNMAMSKIHYFRVTSDPTGTVSILIKGPKVRMLESGMMSVLIQTSAPGYQPKTTKTSFELIKR
jgi:hypothetical protein